MFFSNQRVYFIFQSNWLISSICGLLLLLATPGAAQNKSTIDSLKLVLDKTSGQQRGPALIDVALAFGKAGDYEASFPYLAEAYEVAAGNGDTLTMVRSLNLRGELSRRLEKISDAIRYLELVLPIAKRHNDDPRFHKEYKKILNSLAVSNASISNYDEALKLNFESLAEREKDGDKKEISIALHNLGHIYAHLKNYPSGLDFSLRALELKKESNDNHDMDRLLVNIGICESELGHYDKAFKYLEEAFQHCGGDCDPPLKMEGNFAFAQAFKGAGKDKLAREYYEKAEATAKEIDNKLMQANCLFELAVMLNKGGDYKGALLRLNGAEQIAAKLGYNDILINTYKAFSDVYNAEQNFEETSRYQRLYINLKDSIYNAELISNIAKFQSDFEERQNIAIIATKEETINRQRSLNIAIGIITLLAILLIFVLFHSNRVKKRVNHALSEAKHFIELKNAELDRKVAEKTADLEVANDSLSKVNEELDNFIYKTSHDIRGPLASLKGICNVALMDVKDPTALDYLEKLDMTAENLNVILTRLLIINQINSSLMKPELINFDGVIDEVMTLQKKRGLPPRLEVRRHINAKIEFYCDREFIRIILENLIDNAIKFYNDSEHVNPFVDIRVEEDKREMRIRVIDNGIGISEAKPDKIFQMFSRASERSSTGGIGLYITKTATEKIGGHVGLRTTPEGYTEFYVKFALDQMPLQANFSFG